MQPLSLVAISLLLWCLSLQSTSSAQSFGVQSFSNSGQYKQVAVDSAGFVYAAGQRWFSEAYFDAAVKFSTDGNLPVQTFDTSAQNSGVSPSLVVSPFGIAVDSSNNVYVSSSVGNSRPSQFSNGTALARKFSPNGTVLQTYDFSQYYYAASGTTGLAVDFAGALYVCFTNSVVKFNTTGAAVQTFSASLNMPSTVVVENGTNAVYVLDAGNSRIVKFSAGGAVLATQPYMRAAGFTGNGYGIAIDPRDGTIIVACQPVQRFTTSLVPIASYTLPAIIVGSGTYTASIYGAAVSSNGTIYLPFSVSSAVIIALHFEQCPTGYSCAAGVSSAVICPIGSYCPANQTAYGAQVLLCPIPSCCLTSGLTQPTCASPSSSSSSSSAAKASSSSIISTSSSGSSMVSWSSSSSSSSSASSSTSSQSFGVQHNFFPHGTFKQVAVDSAGSPYAAGRFNFVETTLDSVVTWPSNYNYWSSFIDTEYSAVAPYGVVVDSSFNVYASSSIGSPPGGPARYGTAAAAKFAPNGTKLQTYDLSPYYFVTSGGTSGLALDAGGALYVCLTNTVVKFNTTGALVQTFSAVLSSPSGVAVDNTANTTNAAVYVLDHGNSRIVKFDAAGNVLQTAPYAGGGYGIAIDPRDGTIIVASQPVQRFTTSLAPIASYTLPGTIVGSQSVYGVAVSSNGTMYITVANDILALHFEQCPTGYSCSAGLDSATICPIGSYCPANQTAYGAVVITCPIPSCCLTRGLNQPTCASPSVSSSSSSSYSSSTSSSSNSGSSSSSSSSSYYLSSSSSSSSSPSSSTPAQSFGVQHNFYGRGSFKQAAIDVAGFLYAAGRFNFVEINADSVVKYTADDSNFMSFIETEYSAVAPYGVVVDSSFNMYVSSSIGNVGRYGTAVTAKFAPNGTKLQTYDLSPYYFVTSGGTSGLALDAGGALYVCLTNTVVKFNTTGALVQTFSAVLSSPSGVAVDNTANTTNAAVYVLDHGNSRIVKFDAAGNVLQTAPYAGGGYGIAIDPRDGTIIVASQPVQRFTTSLAPIASYTLPGTIVGSQSVYGVAVSSNGTMYITVANDILALHFEQCPTGYSCSAGLDSATICPIGSYCPANQTAYGAVVITCPIPSCCLTRGLNQPTCASPSVSSSSSSSYSSSTSPFSQPGSSSSIARSVSSTVLPSSSAYSPISGSSSGSLLSSIGSSSSSSSSGTSSISLSSLSSAPSSSSSSTSSSPLSPSSSFSIASTGTPVLATSHASVEAEYGIVRLTFVVSMSLLVSLMAC